MIRGVFISSALVTLTALSACGNSTGGSGQSGFADAIDIDTNALGLTAVTSGFGNATVGTGGYVYHNGITSDGMGFAAQAGITPGANMGPAVTTGGGTLNGTYRMHNLHIVGSHATETYYSNSMLFTADFANGTLTASDGTLTINGTFVGTTLDGNVIFQGTQGDMMGVIGAAGALGAFVGDDGVNVYSGGFIAE